MVARELTKHCFHRILRCLCSFAVDVQLLNRCLASTYKDYTYFAVHLLHGCARAHQLLPSYPALPLQFRSRCPVAQPMSRFNIQVPGYKGFASPYKHTRLRFAALWRPVYLRRVFSCCLRLYKTQGFASPYKHIRHIREDRFSNDILQGRSDFVAAMHYC